VEVLVDGQWWPGELCMGARDREGWSGQGQWLREVGMTFVDTYMAVDIRELGL
jgi:hypothetical protein